jgi:hypothetical protein
MPNTIEVSNQVVLARQGWSGVDGDGTRDDTTRQQVSFSSSEFSDQIRIYPDWLDASNSRWVEVELAADENDEAGVSRGFLRIYRREGGSDVLIDELEVAGLFPDTVLTLTACVDEFSVIATVLNGRLDADAPEVLFAGPTPGSLTAVGTGTITGVARFHSWSVTHHIYSAECPDCAGLSFCTCLSSVDLPALLMFIVPPLGAGVCSGCESLSGTVIARSQTVCAEGTHVLTEDCDIVEEATTVCNWRNDVEDVSICGHPFTINYLIQIERVESSNEYFVVGSVTIGAQDTFIWRESLGVFASPPDLTELIDGLELPFLCQDEPEATAACSAIGTTARVRLP